MDVKLVYLEAGNKKFPAYASLNVLEWAQNEYGTLDNFNDALSGGESGEPSIGALINAFQAMINEGIDYVNDMEGKDEPLLTKKQVGRVVTQLGLHEAMEKLNEIMGDDESDSGEPEADSKNAKGRGNK